MASVRQRLRARTLRWWEDEQQLIDIEQEDERRASRRSDYRDEY